MSRKVEIIEVCADRYTKAGNMETLMSYDHKCPNCGGYGKHIPYQVGAHEYKTETCEQCHGSGKLQAEITIRWQPQKTRTCATGGN